MDKVLEKRLARLYNLPTCYEVAAINRETGQRVLLFYSARFTRSVVTSEVRHRIDHIDRITGVPSNSWAWGAHIKDGVTGKDANGRTWHIGRTGRTQRQAFITGELDYVGDIQASD